MRKLTVEEIAMELINNDSMEVEGSKATYFMHITDKGEILPTLAGADETFTTETDAPDEDGDWREDFEDLANDDFRTICEDLCRQANDYLETWGGREMKIYFESNNAFRNVIFTDGETAKIFNGTGDGKFDGIYLYGDIDQVIEQLKKHFAEADLNDYDEINGDLTVDYEELADEIDDMAEIY